MTKGILGTAQFGMNYGLTNTKGIVSDAMLTKILNQALNYDIKTLDTSFDYGNAISRLKKYPRFDEFDIILKLPLIPEQKISKKIANSAINKFISQLEAHQMDSINTLLTHGADDLTKPGAEYLYEELQKLKSEKVSSFIGASIYSKKQAAAIINQFNIDTLQIPYSIIDQRFLQSGLLKELKKKNIKIHARSIFLQGMLLTQPAKLPQYFDPIKPKLIELNSLAKRFGHTVLSAALNFVYHANDIDAITFGITSINELQEIYRSLKDKFNINPYLACHSPFEKMVDPRQWPSFN